MSVGKETMRTVGRLCKNLVLEYPKDKYDPEKHLFHMSGFIAEDIDKTQPPVDLYGKYYLLYKESLANLRKELALEYLSDRDLKDSLWHFVCEIIANVPTYRNLKRLNERTSEFLSDITKPIKNSRY